MKKIRQAFTRLRKSQFISHILVLATGTLLAQAIPILSSPLLTRLFTPADFGVFAVFMALVSSLTPIVCGKYEVAMVLPKNNRQGKQLLGIAIEVAFVVSFVFIMVVILCNEWLLKLLGSPRLPGGLYLAPLALLFTGIMVAMSYYANRHQQYALMARGKILQALLVVIVNIVLGVIGYGASGLISGAMVGLVFSVVYLSYSFKQEFSWDVFKWNRRKAFLIKRYKDFPIYNSSSGMLNGLTLAMPIFFLTKYYPVAIVGFYALTLRVGNAPLAFISSSVSQVNLKKVVDLVNSGQSVRLYLVGVTAGLIAVVMMPTLILVFYSQEMFSFVFGKKWGEAGLYMQILAPALAVRFVASTLSTTLGATKNNKLGMIWKVTAFIVTLLVFAWYAPKGNIVELFQAVVIMDIFLYSLYYLIIWKAAAKPKNSMM